MYSEILGIWVTRHEQEMEMEEYPDVFFVEIPPALCLSHLAKYKLVILLPSHVCVSSSICSLRGIWHWYLLLRCTGV